MTDERPSEVGARLERLRGLMERRRLAAVLLQTRRNFAWLTAGGENHVLLSTEQGVAPLLVTRDEVVAITQNIEAARIAEEELAGLGIETVPVPWWETGAIAAEAKRRAGRSPATDDDVEDELLRIRSVLSPFDQRRLEELGALARSAVEGTLDRVAPGVTEDDLAAEVVARARGTRAPVVLVAADDRIARYRHPLPTPAPIRRRVMLVLVAERWGLHVAITRFRELEPPPAALAARIEAVAEVERAFHDATREEATIGDVLLAGQAAYARAGFGTEWREHHQGGTIAYQGRETIATPGDRTPIAAGMAFAWNPSIAGAKAENTFVLRPGGDRRLVTS